MERDAGCCQRPLQVATASCILRRRRFSRFKNDRHVHETFLKYDPTVILRYDLDRSTNLIKLSYYLFILDHKTCFQYSYKQQFYLNKAHFIDFKPERASALVVIFILLPVQSDVLSYILKCKITIFTSKQFITVNICQQLVHTFDFKTKIM